MGEVTDAVGVADDLTKWGFGELAPKPNTPQGALKIAVDKIYNKRGITREELPARSGYALFNVVPVVTNGVETHDHQKMFSVKWPTSSGLNLIFADPKTGCAVSPKGSDECQEIYERELLFAGRHKIMRVLTLAVERMNGVSLRDKGGLYWIPERSVATFSRIAEIVSNHGGVTTNRYGDVVTNNMVSLLRTAHDVDSARAICHALKNTIAKNLEANERDCQKENPGERMVKNRKQEAIDTHTMVEEFSEILGETLDELKAHAKAVEAHACSVIDINFGFGE